MNPDFSIGLLLSCRELLRLLLPKPQSLHDVRRQLARLSYSDTQSVLDMCQACGWLRMEVEGVVAVSEKGVSIVGLYDEVEALRAQLHDAIAVFSPAWTYLLVRGRAEARSGMPDNAKECFENAELFSDISTSGVIWWDRLASAARGNADAARLLAGREAEKLSLRFEKQRTGREPKWRALESNSFGFDLQSIVDKKNFTALLIEVKSHAGYASNARIFLSRYESEVSLVSKRYLFHIWVMRPTPTLYILEKEAVLANVPLDRKKGEWQDVCIELSKSLGKPVHRYSA